MCRSFTCFFFTTICESKIISIKTPLEKHFKGYVYPVITKKKGNSTFISPKVEQYHIQIKPIFSGWVYIEIHLFVDSVMHFTLILSQWTICSRLCNYKHYFIEGIQ